MEVTGATVVDFECPGQTAETKGKPAKRREKWKKEIYKIVCCVDFGLRWRL